MKYKNATMTFYAQHRDRLETINVLASECCTFAIHRPINMTFDCKWTVSHKTGFFISHFRTMKQAKLFVERAHSAIDWNRIKVNKNGSKLTKKTQAYLREVCPIVRDIRDLVVGGA